MAYDNIIKIGTRGSMLALIQAEIVKNAFEDRFPDYEFEIVPMRTEGDRNLSTPLSEFGGKGVFVTEIEDALTSHRIDFAVHSMKDMPMDLGEGLDILAVVPREDARDVLVTLKNDAFFFAEANEFTKKYFEKYSDRKIIIGTGSGRRIFQLNKLYSERGNIVFRNIRGNVQTRLSHIGKDVDAVVLAMAGLIRLGLSELSGYYYRTFNFKEIVPAGGQGTIAIEGIDDEFHRSMAAKINDEKSFRESEIERYILRRLDAGCTTAIGVKATIFNDNLCLNINFDEHTPSFMNALGKESDWKNLADEMINNYL